MSKEAKNINIICLKEQQALALIYSGKSKTQVRKKLNVKVKKLKKWIENDPINELTDKSKIMREKAVHMYFYKIPKDEICGCLGIDMIELNRWIKLVFESNFSIRSGDYIKTQNQLPHQAGRTNFITEICKKNKDYYEVLRLYKEGYSAKSIATILKVPIDMVNINIMESKRKIKIS